MSLKYLTSLYVLACLLSARLESRSIDAGSATELSSASQVNGQTKQGNNTKRLPEEPRIKREQPIEEILNNGSIIQLLKAELEEDLIITKIQKTKHNFDLSTDGLIALKQGGASGRLIHFMMNPSMPPEPKKEVATAASGSAAPLKIDPKVPNNAGSTAVAAGPPLPTEIGIYIKKDDQWVDIQPEVVNWKTGGVLKNIASAGIVKGDVNGRINGTHSRNGVKTPLEFLVYVSDGVAITEYQLLKLHEQKDSREFRTVTGGVLHVSGGATRDLLQFEGKKLATRMYIVNLPTLGAGEYGFMPPGAFASSHSSSTLGKMYTFRVGE